MSEPDRNTATATADPAVAPPERTLDLVFLGLSITSSWGNGHATNYRALVRALDERGHEVLFLERDVPWYRRNRDLPDPPWCELDLYDSPADLRERHAERVRSADAVIVGSYVPDGVPVGHWVNDTATGVSVFYDIDTPITIGKLEEDDREYLEATLVPRYDLYLSFTSGPLLDVLEEEYGSPAARPFHCLVDARTYRPRESAETRWELGYLGTHSPDRQPGLERLLLEPARRAPELRFCVAGPGYPDDLEWPPNVERMEHLPPPRHRRFYTSQRFTLNVTRDRMVRSGWSPSVRLFEAAACGVPVISDEWPGLESFFTPGEEILVGRGTGDILRILREIDSREAQKIGARARRRVLDAHTARHRAQELEEHVRESRMRRTARDRPARPKRRSAVSTRTIPSWRSEP